MIRSSLAIRTAATISAAVAVFLLAQTGVDARSHKSAPSASPAAVSQGEQLTQVLPRLEQAFAEHPADPQIGAQLANVYLQAGRADLALNVTSRLLTNGQRTAPVLYFAGLAYEQLGQKDNALKAMELAQNVDPTSGSVLLAITSMYLEHGRLNDALRAAKREVTFNGNDERAHLNFAMTLAIAHQADAARSEYLAAQTLAPTDPRPSIGIGRTYLEAGDAATAVQAYSKALVLEPNNLDSLNGLAAAYAAGRNVPMAIKTLEQMLALVQDPRAKVAVMAQESKLLLQAKQPQLAEQSLRRGVVAFPTLDIAHVAYGDFFALIGNVDQASKEWAIAAGPEHNGHDGLLRLGTLALNMNRQREAITIFSRMVSLTPKDDGAWNNLGQAYFNTRDFGHALQAYRQAYALNHSPDALAGLANCDYELHNSKEALQIYDMLLSQVPGYVANNPRLLFTMGNTYAMAHQNDKARAVYQRLLSLVQKNSPQEKVVTNLLAILDKPQTGKSLPKAVPAAKHAHTHPAPTP